MRTKHEHGILAQCLMKSKPWYNHLMLKHSIALQDNASEETLVLDNPYIRRWDPRTGETYYEHRAVAEWKLGRPLEQGEVVHHDNGDKRDNHPENIFVFSSQRAHMLYENYRLREALGRQHLFTIDEVLGFDGQWLVR